MHDPSPDQSLPAPLREPEPPQALLENPPGRGQDSPVPREIRRWNWGAFFFGWFWGIFNRVWISFLTLIPLVSFVMMFVLGAKGSQWAWQKKQWSSIEHFKRVQRQWGIAAAVVAVLSLIVGILMGFFGEIPVERDPDPNPELTQVIESEDGAFRMLVPESWLKDDTLHDDPTLGASNVGAVQFVLILAEPIPARRPMTLAEFSELTKGFLVQTLEDASETPARRVEVGDHEGLQAEIRGEAEGEDIVYLHTAVVGDEHMFQILAWTLASEWDYSGQLLRNISASVHES